LICNLDVSNDDVDVREHIERQIAGTAKSLYPE